uniref:Glutaredoxin-2, mitochondrial n=1 Tax=Chelonoidis abingdonii TaxID=106734 RepID=A0A8C0J8P5_CHEAB
PPARRAHDGLVGSPARRRQPAQVRSAGSPCSCSAAGITHVQNTLTQPFFFFLIQETISDNCVVIFSKTTCGYCKMAKKLFQDMNVNYTAVELDLYENGSQFQDILHQMTGGRTVPRVFINGAFIGGATDTQRLHQEGKLLPLVHQCQMRRAKNSDLPCSLP